VTCKQTKSRRFQKSPSGAIPDLNALHLLKGLSLCRERVIAHGETDAGRAPAAETYAQGVIWRAER